MKVFTVCLATVIYPVYGLELSGVIDVTPHWWDVTWLGAGLFLMWGQALHEAVGP